MKAPIDHIVISSETNWYQIESKMRRLIHELLVPVVTRAHEDRDSLEKNEKNLTYHATRLDNIEQYLFAPGHPKKTQLCQTSIVASEKGESPMRSIDKDRTLDGEVRLRNSNNSGIEIDEPEVAFEPEDPTENLEMPKNFTKLDEIDLKLDKIKTSVLTHQ